MAIVITRAQGTNPIAPLTIFNRTTQQAKRANPHFRKIINFGYLIELFWGSPFKARVQENIYKVERIYSATKTCTKTDNQFVKKKNTLL